jgi:hypothetical protein
MHSYTNAETIKFFHGYFTHELSVVFTNLTAAAFLVSGS